MRGGSEVLTPTLSTVPQEVLNNLSSISPHKLLLEIGAPILLLRNICAARGLANGTRCIVLGFTNRVIQADIVSGGRAGQVGLIPRMNMTSGQNQPFVLRRQFPVRLAFAMSLK
jgi:ATP-dependent DNA helicase PIF1